MAVLNWSWNEWKNHKDFFRIRIVLFIFQNFLEKIMQKNFLFFQFLKLFLRLLGFNKHFFLIFNDFSSLFSKPCIR
jgi:hypothetical protein